jgi:hypothetical protein
MNASPITRLLPRSLPGGFVADYYPHPEVGVEVFIWRSAHRNDGFMVACANWGAVYRLLRDIRAGLEGRK